MQKSSRETFSHETEDYYCSHTVKSSLRHLNSRKATRNTRSKDKSIRATVEQVLDPRTRFILYKLINRNYLKQVNGCISTGKEANVYHALSSQPDDSQFPELAIKVYKTSILVFKDRDRYVQGEYRFRNGYSRHNPRMMVRLWAEKEMRNLIRINEAGIPSPRPILLRKNIVIMSFIGHDGVAAPLLKDSKLSPEQYSVAYDQIIRIMRVIFHKCHLIHADLSPYNILYYQDLCYIIDVGQAVEYDHPTALEFLRRDICNINLFFLKNQICTLTNRELFDFICDVNLPDYEVDAYLDKLFAISSGRTVEQIESLNAKEFELFMNYFIPRTLGDISTEDFILDRYHALIGDTEYPVYHRKLLGLNKTLSGANLKNDFLHDQIDQNLEEFDSDLRRQRAEEMKQAYVSFKRSIAFESSDCRHEHDDDCSCSEDDQYDDDDEDDNNSIDDDDDNNIDDDIVDVEDDGDDSIDDDDDDIVDVEHDDLEDDEDDNNIDDDDDGDDSIDDAEDDDSIVDDVDDDVDDNENDTDVYDDENNSIDDNVKDYNSTFDDNTDDYDDNNSTCNNDNNILDHNDSSASAREHEKIFKLNNNRSLKKHVSFCDDIPDANTKANKSTSLNESKVVEKHRSKSGKKITDLPKEERRAHKKNVKEIAREKRKNKVPKHVKKRAHKVSKRK